MKRNIRVNISGMLFNMDEDAYEALQAYLQKLEERFGSMAGGREIIDDIESGIAEMLNTKLNEHKSIINLADVEDVTRRMGDPGEIFEEAGEEPSSQSSRQEAPDWQYAEPVRRKLYRDPDSRVIGGVAAGLAKYFNIDVILVRVLFILLSFLGGPGVLIYIILWIVVPEARTTTQKLEMEGESVTIDNIERKIREELNKLGDQLNDLKEKHFKKKSVTEPANSFFHFLGRVIMVLIKAIGIAIGAVLFVLAILFVLMLIPAFGAGAGDLFFPFHGAVYFSLPEIVTALYSDYYTAKTVLWVVTGILFLPLIYIITAGIGFIFNLKPEVAGIKKAIGILWLVLLITGIFFTGITWNSFDKEAEKTERIIPENTTSADTLFLQLASSGPRPYISDDLVEVYDNFDNEFMLIKTDSLYYCTPLLKLCHTNDSLFMINLRMRARGESRRIAEKNLNGIRYKVENIGNTLYINPFYVYPATNAWRAQRVELELCVPRKTVVKVIENPELRGDFYRELENEMRFDLEWN